MAKVVLGLSSSVSLYKSFEILRGFQKAGHEVQVIMTRNASRLISPPLFNSLSGRRTIIELFEEGQPWSATHVSLAKEASLFVIAPATANVLAKLAWGIADDFLSTFYLAWQGRTLVAPAMNEAMLFHPQTQENIRRLKARGVDFAEPGTGYLACGEQGCGRLADPPVIVERGLALMTKRTTLQGKTVLVTAGPTREFLDPVRFLSNRSSGKMGTAMAREAVLRGARVIFVTGPSQVPPPAGAELVRIESAADMEREVLVRFGEADVVVMAAAVSDFTFSGRAGHKMKKEALPESLKLVRTTDILKALGAKKTGQFLVGFAAETEDLKENALKKAREKNLDFIVANDVSREGIGIECDENQALLIDAGGRTIETPVLSKIELSRVIWDALEASLGNRR